MNAPVMSEEMEYALDRALDHLGKSLDKLERFTDNYGGDAPTIVLRALVLWCGSGAAIQARLRRVAKEESGLAP